MANASHRRNLEMQGHGEIAESEEETQDVQGVASSGAQAKDPNPDGFVGKLERLPKGFETALTQAEDVLLDRTLRLFDEQYDEMFMLVEEERQRSRVEDAAENCAELSPGSQKLRSRPGRHHLDARVLECRLSKRYESFEMPQVLKECFDKPVCEKD